jgi:hypothetical protein
MKLNILTVVVGLGLLITIFELLRRRQLREKYAVLWIVVGLGVIPLAIFPRGLDAFATMIGVASGVSLILFAGILLVLLICTHLSWEVSRLEEETRTLSEEVALLNTRLAELESRELSSDNR